MKDLEPSTLLSYHLKLKETLGMYLRSTRPRDHLTEPGIGPINEAESQAVSRPYPSTSSAAKLWWRKWSVPPCLDTLLELMENPGMHLRNTKPRDHLIKAEVRPISESVSKRRTRDRPAAITRGITM